MASVLGFLIILGPLVVIHELGHYLFARLFNVKAEVFSIGFGPRLFARKWGETDFRLSLIPLGGYVKLLGEDRTQPLSAADAKRSLHNQDAWKRFLIFFGGPLFNFLGAIAIFMLVLIIGERQISSQVARVVQGSPAEKVGFKSGDLITRVGDKSVDKFEDVLLEIAAHPGRALQFSIERDGKPMSLVATAQSSEGLSLYGESKQVGEIDGLVAIPRSGVIGVSDPQSAAAKAGLRTGDVLTQMNGKLVENWEDFERQFKAAPVSGIIDLQFARAKSAEPVKARFVKPAAGEMPPQAWGMHSAELFVEKTMSKSPAESSGLKSGDRLLAVSGTEVRSFYELRENVQRAGEKAGKLTLKWERDGVVQTAVLVPSKSESRDALLKKVATYTIGVVPVPFYGEPAMMIERVWNPFVLVYRATAKMVVLTYRNLVSIQKMLVGEVSTATLGGPIMIGKIAGEALTSGVTEFLSRMAFFSVGLGVLNVLPIPVLDGGHILLLAVERIRRRPLTLKQMGVVQLIGLAFILALMVTVLHNDISRI